jgi:hypothetical protein
MSYAIPHSFPWLFGFVTPLLGQTGTTKSLIGWVIVLLCIGLGLLVVCRPSGRQASKGK